MKKAGKRTIIFDNPPSITGYGSCAGKKEGEGPLGKSFDEVFDDDMLGQKSWEDAEKELQIHSFTKALEKAGKQKDDPDIIFAGDLLNQCIASAYASSGVDCSYMGQYGACSTMAQTIILSSIFCESGAANCAAAITSSHFCSAERQYRNPIDYGGQRTPTAQWTVTGSGSVIIESSAASSIRITAATIGKITDFGICDANNMGASMAPAAAETISDFLADTAISPEKLDLILTGDLGVVGSDLLIKILEQNGIDIKEKHNDCGKMIFDIDRQDVHAGGSGCGCSASVLCGHILPRVESGDLKSVLFVATGSLQSPLSVQQGKSMPAIAHAVLIESGK
ncbi:MAG: stage V sporulation protein AD [Clostridia bacterium]|nr:stage V sporulation protein AD [Clostridia bacterium]